MSSHTAYLDCFSGISGDMLLAALLDAGLPLALLEEQLARLPLSGYQLQFSRERRGGISAGHLQVRVEEKQNPRGWREISALLEQAELAAQVKELARRIFTALAAAEGKIHDCPPEKVHFHEVGALDSIVDIVGAAIGLHHFAIRHLACSPLPMARGWVNCQHGPLPLPAPATMELLRGLPVYGVDLEMELVTPTGAAVVKALAQEFGPLPPLTLSAIGYGAGSRERPDGRPNLLRLLIGRPKLTDESQEVEVIETQLDDWAAEGFPHLCEQLFARRALDVSLTPLLMKKGRPGYLLRVLADPAHAHDLKDCLLSETTAIGLRFHRQQRLTLPRRPGRVTTPWGEIAVKKVETPQGSVLYPEYESCRAAARRHQVPLLRIHSHVAALPPEQCKEEQDG
ncbi:nickel pincer cofactor biosynthesis protein LarC [Desulfurivibrio sp. D14AmB]|uniref:nickel pincer cofactor biosynthesis protein LarC n=1 Tax=Desulfurivibrio sp. D14AmB TaxID=3374370 RepID=UPI00376ECC16